MEEKKDLELLKLIIEEEHYFIEAHQKRIEFYTGIITALFVGLGLGIVQITEWYHFIYIGIASLMIPTISIIGIKGTFRLYQRTLESITMRAKIEQKLGFTNKIIYDEALTDMCWKEEPLIPLRYLKSRQEYESSKDFVNHPQNRVYHNLTIKIFGMFSFLGIVLFIFFIALGILKYVN